MQNSVKISVLHVVLLSMTVIGLKNHVTILPPILEVAKRDGWMSVILGLACVIPFLWCMYTYNKTAKLKKYTPIHYIIACLILVLCAMTMVEMLMWVQTTFLPETPILVMFSCYFIACLLFAMLGIQAIVTVNVIVLAGVLILGFFVAFVNIQVKDYSLLLPMLEHGAVPVMKASVFPASGYIELVLLLFLLPYFKERLKFIHFLLMAVLLAGLTLGPLVGAIVEFGPEEASKQRYPAFEEWGLAAIGRFIDHMDFFSVYQWMTGAFIRVSFYLFITIEIFGLTQQPKKVWMYIAPPFAIISFILMLLDENIFVYINNYALPIITFGVLALFCLFVWLTSIKKRKKERKKERKYDEQPIVR